MIFGRVRYSKWIYIRIQGTHVKQVNQPSQTGWFWRKLGAHDVQEKGKVN